ncbi:hypothetical protein BH09ACT4_BH09ACT4_11810 [soil metagenome]
MSERTPAQANYQVRFDWGHAGAASVGVECDAIVWVDQLGSSEAPVDAVAGTLEQATELGAWALARQHELGGRFRIAVIAAGATRADGSLRFAVEDLLAAGAIIDAIAEVGIDHQSPEAAAAAAAYTGLRTSTRHLISASESSRELPEG